MKSSRMTSYILIAMTPGGARPAVRSTISSRRRRLCRKPPMPTSDVSPSHDDGDAPPGRCCPAFRRVRGGQDRHDGGMAAHRSGDIVVVLHVRRGPVDPCRVQYAGAAVSVVDQRRPGGDGDPRYPHQDLWTVFPGPDEGAGNRVHECAGGPVPCFRRAVFITKRVDAFGDLYRQRGYGRLPCAYSAAVASLSIATPLPTPARAL